MASKKYLQKIKMIYNSIMSNLEYINKIKELKIVYAEKVRQIHFEFNQELQKLRNKFLEEKAIKESFDKDFDNFFLY